MIDLTWILLFLIILVSFLLFFPKSTREASTSGSRSGEDMGNSVGRLKKKKSKKAEGHAGKKVLASISSDAKSIGNKLGIEPLSTVTFYSKDVDGQIMNDVITSETFKSIFEYADVYLITWVESDEEEQNAIQTFEAAGLVSSSETRSPGKQPRHKFLFCSTEVGKRALLRQLKPQIHIDTSEETLKDQSRFLPRVYQLIKEGQNTDEAAWECLTNLADLRA
mmetsp:Transcript_10548/g.17040  ORF Transcript_10548/g.17040 Transcript_10548/m.17040 type:complete len:222 (+) Transcript_10548:69-734(+)